MRMTAVGRTGYLTGTKPKVEQRIGCSNQGVVIGSSGVSYGDGYQNPPALSEVSLVRYLSDQGCQDGDMYLSSLKPVKSTLATVNFERESGFRLKPNREIQFAWASEISVDGCKRFNRCRW